MLSLSSPFAFGFRANPLQPIGYGGDGVDVVPDAHDDDGRIAVSQTRPPHSFLATIRTIGASIRRQSATATVSSYLSIRSSKYFRSSAFVL